MSAIQTIAITLVYLVPVALLALLLIAQHRRHAHWLLTSLLLILPVFYVSHYLLLQQLRGWPSTAALPQQFRLLAFDISEPDPNTDRPGQILLWIHNSDSDQPRVYRLNYRKDLHQELVGAGQRLAEGRPQVRFHGRPSNPAGTGADTDGQEIIRFRDEAGRSLPSKN